MTYYTQLGYIPHKRHTQFQQPDGSLYRWNGRSNVVSYILVSFRRNLLGNKQEKGEFVDRFHDLRAAKSETNQDYILETDLKHLSGNMDYGCGLTWGGADNRNYYAFTISGYSSFAIYKFEDL